MSELTKLILRGHQMSAVAENLKANCDKGVLAVTVRVLSLPY